MKTPPIDYFRKKKRESGYDSLLEISPPVNRHFVHLKLRRIQFITKMEISRREEYLERIWCELERNDQGLEMKEKLPQKFLKASDDF